MLFRYWSYSNSKDSVFFNSSAFAGGFVATILSCSYVLFLIYLVLSFQEARACSLRQLGISTEMIQT